MSFDNTNINSTQSQIETIQRRKFGEYPSDEWLEQYKRTGYMGANILTAKDEAEYTKQAKVFVAEVTGTLLSSVNKQ
mgnify:CR=1 FL=1